MDESCCGSANTEVEQTTVALFIMKAVCICKVQYYALLYIPHHPHLVEFVIMIVVLTLLSLPSCPMWHVH